MPTLRMKKRSRRILNFKEKSSRSGMVKQVCTDTGYSDYRVRKAFAELVKRGLLEIHGSGPSARYAVAANSPEMLTQLQMTVESLKKRLTCIQSNRWQDHVNPASGICVFESCFFEKHNEKASQFEKFFLNCLRSPNILF